jgi:glycosyltransferase involved in cell wall biosynthesis
MCDKLISIIIPYYRAQVFFIETLLSVYKQEGVNKEVIVVNDGSGEHDVAFLKAQQRQFEFTLIHQENKGVSEARNTGIKLAKGEYLLFLDADDTLLPEALKQLSLLDRDVVVGNFYSKNRVLKPSFETNQFIQGNPIQVGTALVKVGYVKKIGGFNENLAYSEDMDFWFRIWENGAQFVHLNNTVLKYRSHDNNAMKKRCVKKMTDNLGSFKYRLNKCRKTELLNNHDFNVIFVSRSNTHHWYARELGWKYMLAHYKFILSINPIIAIKLICKFAINDWRYIKIK